MPINKDLKIIPFESQAKWEQWLAKNGAKAPGVYIRIYKKDSGKKSINAKEAIDGALCYGWIDGIRHGYDDLSFLQKYTPRGAKSIWSKINVANVARLTKAGKMKPAGLKVVEAAKADGRWGRAYDSGKSAAIPNDFLKLLKQDPTANEFYKTLNKTNTYAIIWRLQTATKPETRQKRVEVILRMLHNKEKFH